MWYKNNIINKIKDFAMADTDKKKSQPRSKQRIEREAAALRRNLAKRKQQQQALEKLKKEAKNGQD